MCAAVLATLHEPSQATLVHNCHWECGQIKSQGHNTIAALSCWQGKLAGYQYLRVCC